MKENLWMLQKNWVLHGKHYTINLKSTTSKIHRFLKTQFMVKKKFYINLIIRIIGIIGLSIIMAINLFQYEKLFTVLASGIGLFILGYDLLRYTNKMNRELLSFFEALKYEDHSFGMRKMNIPGFMKMS